MTAADLALALVRTTLATLVGACVAAILLAVLRVDSPRTHRVVWLLVVLQGWLLFPFTLELAAPPQPAPPSPLGAMSSSAWTWTEPTVVTNLSSMAEPEPAGPLVTPTQLALVAWLAGAALITLYAATRYFRIIRVLPLGAPPDDPQWREEWSFALGAMLPGGTPKSSQGVVEPPNEIRCAPRPAADLGRATQSPIHFRITSALGPLVAYIPFAYILLAPRPLWTTLTPAERTAILRHELAHIRRRDLWKSLIIRLLALPQWFNPLVWRAVRRFDEAAEWACDESACTPAARGLASESTALASALLRTVELTSPQRSVGAAGFISAVPPNANSNHRNESALKRRIHRLITPRFKEESAMRKLAVPALLLALAAAQLIRIERVAAQDPPPSQSGSQTEATASDPPPSQGGDRGGTPAAANNPTPDGTSSDAATPSPSPADPPPPADLAPLKRRPYDEHAWPRYIIEPPDMLQLSGVKLIPKGPHKIDAFDVIRVRIATKLPEGPIDDTYAVDADGTINLGWTYGRVRVVGMTIEEVEAELRSQISNNIKRTVEVSAALIATAGAQQIDGQHLVAMDGRVNLGVYGSVYVAGMTIEEARAAIEKKLAEHLEDPQVSVDVHAYNSKVYYVITKGGAKGDDVVRAPITGNDTVLDAIAGVGGGVRSADVKIWIARPAPNGVRNEQILQVAWNDIASGKSDDTNYTLHPGDRLFIDEPRYREPAASGAYAEGDYYTEVRPKPGFEVAPPQVASQASSTTPATSAYEAPVPTVRLSMDPGASPAPPAVSDLQVGDMITVLVDYPRDPGQPRPPVSQIACRIKEIGPGRWLSIEGHQAVAPSWNTSTFSLSGEVRRESIGPGRMVSIREILNLDVSSNLESAATPPSEPAAPTVTIGVRQNGGEQLMPQTFRQGMTVGDALRACDFPNIPVNLAEASISVEHTVPVNGGPSQSARTEVRWDAAKNAPRKGHDHYLQPNDRILIDVTKRISQRWLETARPNETPAQPPQPVRPVPAPPFAQQVMFKLSVVRDSSGDMAELGDSLREDGAATGDTESMLGVLRIMRKDKLVEVVADPQVVTVLGRPASFAVEPQATGEAGQVTTVVAPVSIKDGVLRLEAGMSLGETRIDRGFDLPLGETLVLAAPPHDKAGAGKLYLVVTPELVDAPQPQP